MPDLSMSDVCLTGCTAQHCPWLLALFFCSAKSIRLSWLDWLGTARIATMYRFCLVCVCLSVRVPTTDNFITTSHFAFTWGGLDPFRHVRLSVCPSGPGYLSGAFCPPLPPRWRRAVQSSLELILVNTFKDVTYLSTNQARHRITSLIR